jgi:hypothetical protein
MWYTIENKSLQKRICTTLYFIIGIVLILNGTALTFLITSYHVNFAVIFQALGNFVTLVSSSIVPVLIVHQGLPIRLMASTKEAWGVLFCVCIAFLASGGSLGLLALSQVYQILLVCSGSLMWPLN